MGTSASRGYPASLLEPLSDPEERRGAGQPAAFRRRRYRKQVSAHFGPSERLTVDFSDLDNSTLNIVNGQSGNIFDEHYNDQWNAYYNGRTFQLPFSAGEVQQAGVHRSRLRLEP